MCRLLGIVASEATDYRFLLHVAPRSLAALSEEHPDGWGMAVHSRDRGLSLIKEPACARTCSRFDQASAEARGEVMIAHIRKRTVGPVDRNNTHPFARDGWFFAHNGTIEDRAYIRSRASEGRLSEIEGSTDSEELFAMLLSVIDGVVARGGRIGEAEMDLALGTALAEARARESLGSANFLLSDGEHVYAHRFGRTLFVLERGEHDPVVQARTSSETEATIETHWGVRRRAFLIASERMTDEPWTEMADGTLLHLRRARMPEMRLVATP